MNRDQYNEIFNLYPEKPGKVLVPSDFTKNMVDRTLIWGYDIDRNNHHVYMKNGKVVLFVYNDDLKIIRHEENIIHLNMTLPSKRLYPEASDYEFCRYLKFNGYQPTPSVYRERAKEIFYGLTIENFSEALVKEMI